MQCFHIGVELFLHQLWIDGLVPKMLTFEGANVDSYIGASAPLIAWLSTRGRLGIRLALACNLLGLLALTNVVVGSVLTAPGPFNLIYAEVPNLMMGTFPFMFIPGFLVPLAGGATRACNTGHQQPAMRLIRRRFFRGELHEREEFELADPSHAEAEHHSRRTGCCSLEWLDLGYHLGSLL
jgi:hypothetical protein